MKNILATLYIVLAAALFGQLRAQTISDEIITDSTSIDSVKYRQMSELGLLDDTRSDLIKKCLNHLAESIAEDDKEKVYNLKEYALTLEDSVYLPLTPREVWLIDIYLNRFDDFLNDLVALDSAREAELGPKIIFRTNLYYVVREKVSKNLADIKQVYHTDSHLTETDKDFIDVCLKQLETTPNNHMDIMNRESAQFLEKHPDSQYNNYVKQSITYKFVKDPDGYQLDYAIGGGVNFLSGGITDWFDMGKGSIQMEIRFGVKRWEFSWQFVGMFDNKPKKDITFSNGYVWKKGEKWNVLSNQFCLGRQIQLNEKWTVVPRIGLSYITFNTPYANNNKSNDQKLTSFMPTIGAEISYDKFFFDGNMPCFWGPALRLTVQPIRTIIEEKAVSGAMTTLSLVVKFGLCEPKRVY